MMMQHAERQELVAAYHRPQRSKMCRNWERHGACRFGADCWFEHRGHRGRRGQNSRWSGEGLSREQWGQSQDGFVQPQPPPPPPPPPAQPMAFYIPPMEAVPPAPREWHAIPHNAHNPYEQPAMYPPPPILSIVQYQQYSTAPPPPPPPPQVHDDYDDELWSHRTYPHLCLDGESVVTRDTIPDGLFRSDGEVTDDYEVLLELDKHKVKVGVSETQLDLETVPVANDDPALHDALCVICHMQYDDAPAEPALRLPCSHHYHTSCIKTWLSTNTRCPVCNWDSWSGGKTIVCATPSEAFDDYLDYEDDEAW